MKLIIERISDVIQISVNHGTVEEPDWFIDQVPGDSVLAVAVTPEGFCIQRGTPSQNEEVRTTVGSD